MVVGRVVDGRWSLVDGLDMRFALLVEGRNAHFEQASEHRDERQLVNGGGVRGDGERWVFDRAGATAEPLVPDRSGDP